MSWGSNAAGVTWQHSGGNTGDFDLPGRVTLSTTGTRTSALLSTVWDYDFTVRTSIDQSPTGDWIVSRVEARKYGDTFVSATLEAKEDGSYGFALHEVENGSFTWLAGAALGTFEPAAWYSIRLQTTGHDLRAKVWTGSEEPDHWDLDAATSFSGSGGVGLSARRYAANTNVDPTVAFANLVVPNPQQFDVTRSVNGIVKPHDALADVRLAHPSYIVI